MYSTCFEAQGSSSGRRLYTQVWYNVFYMRVGRRVCSIDDTLLRARLLILMYVKHYTVTVYTTVFLKMNDRV